MNDKVVNIILNASESAGVYKFLDKDAKIIYIGKAKNLKARLKSYLSYSKSLNSRLRKLYFNIADLKYEETENEYEALLLEASLIKKYSPKYNVLLKDGKNYPYIRIDLNKPWPYLELARKIVDDRSLYFGPFPEANVIKQVLRTLNKVFPLIKCRKIKFTNKRPCLNYDMGRCLAPCMQLISKKEYDKIVDTVVNILKGKKDLVIKEMERSMWGFSDAEEFELAIELRDKIASLKKFLDSQPIITEQKINFDFLYRKQNMVALAFVRNGVLLGQKVAFHIETKEELGVMLMKYYEDSNDLTQLLLDLRAIDIVYKKFLREKGLKLKTPRTVLDESRVRKIEKILDARLLDLRNRYNKANKEESDFRAWILKLTGKEIKTDFKIEVYDMSHLSGTEPVGAKVAFDNFIENKSKYRRYKIKQAKGGDDYGMMKEVLERRLKSKNKDSLPNIMLIDGGKGQLDKVYKIIKEQDVLLLSIAKDKTRSKALSKDKIYIKLGDKTLGPFVPPETVLQVLKRLRDEAHRFVISYSRLRSHKVVFAKR